MRINIKTVNITFLKHLDISGRKMSTNASLPNWIQHFIQFYPVVDNILSPLQYKKYFLFYFTWEDIFRLEEDSCQTLAKDELLIHENKYFKNPYAIVLRFDVFKRRIMNALPILKEARKRITLDCYTYKALKMP